MSSFESDALLAQHFLNNHSEPTLPPVLPPPLIPTPSANANSNQTASALHAPAPAAATGAAATTSASIPVSPSNPFHQPLVHPTVPSAATAIPPASAPNFGPVPSLPPPAPPLSLPPPIAPTPATSIRRGSATTAIPIRIPTPSPPPAPALNQTRSSPQSPSPTRQMSLPSIEPLPQIASLAGTEPILFQAFL